MTDYRALAEEAREAIVGYIADLAACLRFYSRVPISAFGWETQPYGLDGFSRAQRALPVAGAIIGALAALVLLAAHAAHAPFLIAAGLAIATLVVVSGAMHEDGLADMSDGLGGTTRAEALDIMKDSRLGSFGVLALIFSIGLRAAAIGALSLDQIGIAALGLIGGTGLSRSLALLPLALLAPARSSGASQDAGKPPRDALLAAALTALVVALLPVLAGANFGVLCIAIILAVAAAGGITRLAERHLGGQTGDVCGAAQQVAEITFLCVLATLAPL